MFSQKQVKRNNKKKLQKLFKKKKISYQQLVITDHFLWILIPHLGIDPLQVEITEL
jgi:hypothetical protein